MSGHAAYIAAAFGITGLVVAAVIAFLVADYRSLRRALARFPDRGAEGEP